MRAILFVIPLSLLPLAGAHGAPPRASPPSSPILGNGGSSAYSATTAGQFAEACKTDESSCSAMVGEVLMDRMQFVPTSHICLSGVAYADKVAPWLAQHPQAAQLPAKDGIYLALTDLYKCGPPNNY